MSVLVLAGFISFGYTGYQIYRRRHIPIGKLRLVKALKLSARLSDEIVRNEGRGSFSESRQAIALAMQPLRVVSGHFRLKSSLWETIGKIDLALTDFSSAKSYFDAALQAYDQIENKDPVRRLALFRTSATDHCSWVIGPSLPRPCPRSPPKSALNLVEPPGSGGGSRQAWDGPSKAGPIFRRRAQS